MVRACADRRPRRISHGRETWPLTEPAASRSGDLASRRSREDGRGARPPDPDRRQEECDRSHRGPVAKAAEMKSRALVRGKTRRGAEGRDLSAGRGAGDGSPAYRCPARSLPVATSLLHHPAHELGEVIRRRARQLGYREVPSCPAAYSLPGKRYSPSTPGVVVAEVRTRNPSAAQCPRAIKLTSAPMRK